jgi:hypothetical protein
VSGRAAEQRDELAASYVEHGGFPLHGRSAAPQAYHRQAGWSRGQT